MEYFVYGSTAPDAGILIQVNGSMGTGRLFTKLEGVQTALVEKNIRGISITIPGYGWSSAQPSRSLGEWAKVDVRAVLEQEEFCKEMRKLW